MRKAETERGYIPLQILHNAHTIDTYTLLRPTSNITSTMDEEEDIGYGVST
jgi:hypothetical protein